MWWKMPFFAQGESDVFFLGVICMLVPLLWKTSAIVWLTVWWSDWWFFNTSPNNSYNKRMTKKLGWSGDAKKTWKRHKCLVIRNTEVQFKVPWRKWEITEFIYATNKNKDYWCNILLFLHGNNGWFIWVIFYLFPLEFLLYLNRRKKKKIR